MMKDSVGRKARRLVGGLRRSRLRRLVALGLVVSTVALAVPAPSRAATTVYASLDAGYSFEYPTDWRLQEGDGPAVWSLSDLDVAALGSANARTQGCLVELSTSPVQVNLGLVELAAQLPRTFGGGEAFDLAGAQAVRVKRTSPLNQFDGEAVYALHDGTLYVVTFEHTRNAEARCASVWGTVLDTWQWPEDTSLAAN